MKEWEGVLEKLNKESETSIVLELLGSLKPFIREEEVKEKVLDFLLNFGDRLVRIKSTEILEELESADNKVIEALVIALLNDPDAFVRGFSAKVLGKIGDIRAIEALKKAREDEDGFVRHYAEEALRILEMKTRLLSVIQRAKGG